jgi:hypothetical protein
MNTNVKVKLDFTPEQAAKLRRAHKANRPVSIRLAHHQLFSNNGTDVELTHEKYKKVLSAYKSKNQRGVQITFESHQIGGFLFLLPLLAKAAILAAKVAPIAAKAGAVAAKVGSTALKVAPQIAKVAVKAAPSAAKALASGAVAAAGEQAVGAIVNKIASDKAEAQIAQQNAMEGQGLLPLGHYRGKGLIPLGGRGLIPLGSQRPRGKGLMTYPSKKKAHR